MIFLALPEVTVHDLSEDWDFLVLACDGIWDVLTNQVRKTFSFSYFKNENFLTKRDENVVFSFKGGHQLCDGINSGRKIPGEHL